MMATTSAGVTAAVLLTVYNFHTTFPTGLQCML